METSLIRQQLFSGYLTHEEPASMLESPIEFGPRESIPITSLEHLNSISVVLAQVEVIPASQQTVSEVVFDFEWFVPVVRTKYPADH